MSDVGFNIEQLVAAGELISSDKYLSYSLQSQHLLYSHRDFLYRQGVWRGNAQGRLIKERNLFQNKIIIIGHSDWATNWYQALPFKLFGAKAIYGINVVPWKNFSFPLPLGLTNDCDDSKIHRILGNEKHFVSAYDLAAPPKKFSASIYANFTVANFKKDREPLLNLLKSLPDTLIEKVDMSDRGRISYLANLRNYNLVPCPRGNGVDTHRLWETLYMGGTPVILRNSMIESLISGLPVIVLDDWESLRDRNKMEKLWHESRKNKEFRKLRITFWLEQLNRLEASN